MVFFNALNDSIRIIFIALCALGFIGLLFLLCLCISRRKNIIMTVCTAALAVFSAFNVTRLAYGKPLFSNDSLISGDYAVIVAIAVNISLGTIALIISLAESQREVTSASKLPQYLDNSKDAVLFADKNGRILLANRKIKELCKTITGAELKNANAFKNAAFSARSNKDYTVFNIDGKLIFRFPDGFVWELSRTELDGGNYIIMGTDAVQALDTAERITLNKRLIKETKNRLQWTLDNLDDLKTQTEISEQSAPLRAQIREYADRMYHCVVNDESAKVEQIAIGRIPAEKQLPLIITAFELIGISVSVIGNMPSDPEHFTTLLELLCVSASSSVSFCRAERIRMAIYEGGNKLTANVNCDGTLLHSKHANAFDNITSRIASLGGTLTITKEPSLKLSVMLPK